MYNLIFYKMAKAASFSHVVNGYSRYDVPNSLAASITPGILYPARIDFINARDRVTIEQGVDVRSNPLAVPTFNPYTFRLHRFWVPLQLYHPDMRTNSSKFDMNNLSLNWAPFIYNTAAVPTAVVNKRSFSNSLLSWLRVGTHAPVSIDNANKYVSVPIPDDTLLRKNEWFNCDTYLAYWDIVRNFYSYSQWGVYSFAWPGSWAIEYVDQLFKFDYNGAATFFFQRFGNLEFLDAYYESQFYPAAVTTTNNSYNRWNLFKQIIMSDLDSQNAASSDGFPVAPISSPVIHDGVPVGQFSISGVAGDFSLFAAFNLAHPLAVVPSSPDRFSRLMPVGSSSSVSMTGVSTIPQLAIASRLQEYKDLLGAGGSRYSDWLETFFASKISHVDRPKLLFSASQMVNAQIVLNQSGQSNFEGNQPLGAMGGAIAFNTKLGRVQSYYFEEPGYMIDMISIRPVYYWAQVRPDYLNYIGADYFNPIYNDIGYQGVPFTQIFDGAPSLVNTDIAQEPCFNEFRSSYDEVLGQLNASFGQSDIPIYAYWVQQRSLPFVTTPVTKNDYYKSLFVDMFEVNSPFKSNVEDNFFINMSWSVKKKNLVNKTFATRLSNR